MRHEPGTVMSVIETCRRPRFWTAAVEPDTVSIALKVALVVGTILVLINQGDLLLSGGYPPLWKLLLTYMVPYTFPPTPPLPSRSPTGR